MFLKRALVALTAAAAGMLLVAPMASAAGIATANTATGNHNTNITEGCLSRNGVPRSDCFSMKVAPARLNVTPQDVENHTEKQFTVINNGTTDANIKVFAVEYEQTADGRMRMGTIAHPGEAAKWIKISPSQLSLPPGESKRVSVSVYPSDDASSGDHNISVVFRRPPDASEGHVVAAPQIGTQFIVQIPGPVTKALSLENLHHSGGFGFFGLMQSHSGQTFGMDVVNNGTVHASFRGDDRLTGTITGLGAPDDATVSINDFGVTRENTRSVKVNWNDKAVDNGMASDAQPWFCLCELKFATSDGHGGTTIQTKSFILFPIWQTILILVVLALAIWLIIIRRRKVKSLHTEISDLRNRIPDLTNDASVESSGEPKKVREESPSA